MQCSWLITDYDVDNDDDDDGDDDVNDTGDDDTDDYNDVDDDDDDDDDDETNDYDDDGNNDDDDVDKSVPVQKNLSRQTETNCWTLTLLNMLVLKLNKSPAQWNLVIKILNLKQRLYKQMWSRNDSAIKS